MQSQQDDLSSFQEQSIQYHSNPILCPTTAAKEAKADQIYEDLWGFPSGSDGKETVCNAGDLGWEDPLEKGKAAHSCILVWRIPWTVQFMGWQRVGYE